MRKRKLKKRIKRLELEVFVLRDDVERLVERLAEIIQDPRLSEIGTTFVTTSVPPFGDMTIKSDPPQPPIIC